MDIDAKVNSIVRVRENMVQRIQGCENEIRRLSPEILRLDGELKAWAEMKKEQETKEPVKEETNG